MRSSTLYKVLAALMVAMAAALLAGSLSLLVSLPTMLVAFARYSRDGGFAVLGANLRFAALMATGSIVGALLGGFLLGVIPNLVLIALAVILLVSAVKVARHDLVRRSAPVQ